MSMWLTYAKVSVDTLTQIQKTPDLLDSIFFEGKTAPGDLDEEKDVFGMDYRTYSAIAEAMAEGVEIEEQDTWTAKAVGVAYGDDLEYEFCYGTGFYFTVEEVKSIAAGLSEEVGELFEEAEPDDFEDDVGAFFKIAAIEGKAVVGGIS